MKKILIALLPLLFLSSSIFGKQHFHQEICNVTNTPLFINTVDASRAHTKKLHHTKVTPGICRPYTYVVSGWGISAFTENFKINNTKLIATINIWEYPKARQLRHKRVEMHRVFVATDYHINHTHFGNGHYRISVCYSNSKTCI